jgi:uncharacterized membrane protein YphA (DoxX/SURF4 family)
MKKSQKVSYYVLLVMTSLLFLFAGYSKMVGVPAQIQSFTVAHLPIWFMYFVGACEILGAIGLWIPKLQTWAAYGLSIILIGAVVTSAIFVNVSAAALPLIVGVILSCILWLGKKRADAKASVHATTA